MIQVEGIVGVRAVDIDCTRDTGSGFEVDHVIAPKLDVWDDGDAGLNRGYEPMVVPLSRQHESAIRRDRRLN